MNTEIPILLESPFSQIYFYWDNKHEENKNKNDI